MWYSYVACSCSGLVIAGRVVGGAPILCCVEKVVFASGGECGLVQADVHSLEESWVNA